MALSNSIREQIDCQPLNPVEDSSDVAADHAAHAARANLIDRNIANAMRDCEPPADFADRLLAKLNVAENIPAEEEKTPATTSRRSWLRMGVIGGLVAAAASIAVAYFATRTPLNEEELVELVSGREGWVNNVYPEDSNEWNSDLAAGDKQRPFYRKDLRRMPIGWRKYPVSLDSGAVAYDMRESHFGTQAVLFSVQPSQSTDVAYTTPPATPQNKTGVWTIALWQREGHLFVLACHGGTTRYRRLVHQMETAGLFESGAIAMR